MNKPECLSECHVENHDSEVEEDELIDDLDSS